MDQLSTPTTTTTSMPERETAQTCRVVTADVRIRSHLADEKNQTKTRDNSKTPLPVREAL